MQDCLPVLSTMTTGIRVDIALQTNENKSHKFVKMRKQFSMSAHIHGLSVL